MHSYISSPGRTIQILNKYKIKLRKNLGQNFLIDTNSARKIASCAGVNSDDVILEIGSGIGSLTEILLATAKKVICVEVDNLMIKVFRDIFEDKIGKEVQLISSDALKIDYSEIGLKYGINKMVSNLPYSIAAPLILKILTESENIKALFATIQKDIALRLLALPGDKNYSSYTVKAKFLADFSLCFNISRNCFMPRPFVDSAVVRADRKDTSVLTGKKFSTPDFFNFVNSCFLHRRKKLVNSLFQDDCKYKLETVTGLLSDMGRGKDVRAQELDLKDYVYLYKKLNM